MCINFFKRRKQIDGIQNEAKITVVIDYQKSYCCGYNSKRHLVLSGNINNESDRDIEIKTKFSPKGNIVPSIPKPSINTVQNGAIIFDNQPKIIKSSIIAKDGKMLLKKNATDEFTFIVKDFYWDDKFMLVIDYEGKQVATPIILDKINNKFN